MCAYSNSGVLASKTRLLVTHQLQFLPAADLIVVMSGGRITHCGTFAELTRSGVDFRSIVDSNREMLQSVVQNANSANASESKASHMLEQKSSAAPQDLTHASTRSHHPSLHLPASALPRPSLSVAAASASASERDREEGLSDNEEEKVAGEDEEDVVVGGAATPAPQSAVKTRHGRRTVTTAYVSVASSDSGAATTPQASSAEAAANNAAKGSGGSAGAGAAPKPTNLIITQESTDTGFADDAVYKQYM
jgi:hypothetical protein